MTSLDGLQKLCFVTVGATAPFDALVEEVLSEPFLQKLSELQYTHLLIQFGHCSASVRRRLEEVHGCCRLPGQFSLSIKGYDFKENIETDILRVKHAPSEYFQEGVVLSHAGSGSILQVLRLGIPLIVVPNPGLMNNHQDELAHILAEDNYVLHGKIGNLVDSLVEAETFRDHLCERPKKYYRTTSSALANVIRDELDLRID